jgi:indolepyruvate ferredoxin oxidoreductase
MDLRDVSLDDKYDLSKRRILLTGTQAIVRLTLMQHTLDSNRGKRTAGYVTGYRGSPLGSIDQQFWRVGERMRDADILFQAGVNEDLAATALWGTQQAELRGEGSHDGVFGVFYGKGPGVDRSGDALKHANLAGTSPWGGVLALMGDDHTCESSTTAHQSEFAFVDAMIPILNPAGIQEILDYGLIGIALSRFAGTWAGLKCVKDTMESTATVDGSIDRVNLTIPDAFAMPPGGLNIRRHDPPLDQEARLHEHKIPAALEFIRANALDRVVLKGGRSPRIGIVTAGKSYLDVLQALDDLGIDEAAAANLGLRVLKLGCTWPVEPQGLREFARGLQTLIVVEEKRGLIEGQVKEILYPNAQRPVVVGKRDEEDRWLFPSRGALDTNDIAVAIGERLISARPDERLSHRIAEIHRAQKSLRESRNLAERTFYFCAGCPYNTATVVPEGSRAYAGIGCHYMVQKMDRATDGYTQMGAEGANWIGEAPFSERGHVFQNVGDGTYYHSGSLAIRAALNAGTTMTFKILFNDAVALTGGQKVEGDLSVRAIAHQVAAEGVARIAIVSEEPTGYDRADLPAGATISHRDQIDAVQHGLADEGGVSVMIYDQTCAAEKRRRRKRGEYPDPDKRVVINELVCEGCGDCGVQSNCVAIAPLETEFGRKRAIDQSMCNKDFSCLRGFCPALVTVHGAKLKGGIEVPALVAPLPDPAVPSLESDYAILITGVGGTGVVTIGALLAMAAHLEGKSARVMDMAGLSQKGGPVTSHIRISATETGIKTIRIAARGADLVLGCDMVVAGSAQVLSAIDPETGWAIVNTHETMPGAFTHDPDYTLPTHEILEAIGARGQDQRTRFIDATGIATALLGDAIATNMFMLGLAYQSGSVPVSHSAIERAIELNGISVGMNVAAFNWGRRAAVDRDAVSELASKATGRETLPLSDSLDEMIARRVQFLTDYQDGSYGQSYADDVAKLREAEEGISPGETSLTEAVARNLFRLMAVKDEYEVARLFTDGSFQDQLAGTFESWDHLEYSMAPPILAGRDRVSGRPIKRSFGPWLEKVLGVLARRKGLRGSIFDPFSYLSERRFERQLLADYRITLSTISAGLSAENHAAAVALARDPESIRGFGHVKESAARKALDEAAKNLSRFQAKQRAH